MPMGICIDVWKNYRETRKFFTKAAKLGMSKIYRQIAELRTPEIVELGSYEYYEGKYKVKNIEILRKPTNLGKWKFFNEFIFIITFRRIIKLETSLKD